MKTAFEFKLESMLYLPSACLFIYRHYSHSLFGVYIEELSAMELLQQVNHSVMDGSSLIKAPNLITV